MSPSIHKVLPIYRVCSAMTINAIIYILFTSQTYLYRAKVKKLLIDDKNYVLKFLPDRVFIPFINFQF